METTIFGEVSTATIKLLFSWGFVVLLTFIYIRCKQIARILQSDDIVKFVDQVGLYLVMFAIARFIASILDFNTGFEIYWATYVVHYTFWVAVAHQINKFFCYLRDAFFLRDRLKELKKKEDEISRLNFSENVARGYERQHQVSSIFREALDKLKFDDELSNSLG